MTSIFASGLLFFFLGSTTLVALPSVSVTTRNLVQSFGVLIGLLGIASLNFQFEIFEQKAASTFAFERFAAGSSPFEGISNFTLQTTLNTPAFALTGDWYAAIGTNAAIVALVLLYCLQTEHREAAVFLLAPAVLNFTMFALRDPIIAVEAFAFTLLALAPNSTRRTAGLIVLAWAVYFTRPENLVVGLIALSFIAYRRSKRSYFRIVFFPVFGASLYAALLLGPRALGVPGSYSALDAPLALERFYASRASRFGAESGGGSNILGGGLETMPLLLRFPLQVVSFILLPLPFEIRTPALALAFFDSIVLFVLLRKFFARASREAHIVVIVFVCTTAAFSSNYGNSFRLRLPLYFILAAGIVSTLLSEREEERAGSSSSDEPTCETETTGALGAPLKSGRASEITE